MQKLRLLTTIMTTAIMTLFNAGQIYAQTGNVGIGTTTPLARLHVTDSAVVFTGPTTLPVIPSNPPISGAGIRMMWYPQKAAFRVGQVDETNPDYWDNDNIGTHSFAGGFGTRAYGIASFSMGIRTQAIGNYSTSLGASTAANNSWSTSMGSGTIANGKGSTSMGVQTEARAYAGVAIGMYNDPLFISNSESSSPTNPLFIVGNGNSSLDKSNAMVVFKNGNTDISGFTQLGSDAPAIKVKKYTINTSSTVGGTVQFAHGLNAAKILSVNAVLAYFSADDLIPPSYLDAAGFEYNVSITAGNVFIRNKGGNSSQILNKQVRITITYEE